MKDFLGKELRADQKIVYATRRKSTLRLNEAIVVEVGPERILIQKVGGRMTFLQKTRNAVIVP